MHTPTFTATYTNFQYTDPIMHTPYIYNHTHTNFQNTDPIMHTPYIYNHIHQFPVHTPYKAHSLHLQPHTPISAYFNHICFLYIFLQFTDILRTD